MSKKIGGVVALAAMCALSLFLLNCGSSSSRPSGVLYVLTQGSNGIGEPVSSFAIDLDSGDLSLINSNASTCATAGDVRTSPGHFARPDGRDRFCSESGHAMCARGNCVSLAPAPCYFAFDIPLYGELGWESLGAGAPAVSHPGAP